MDPKLPSAEPEFRKLLSVEYMVKSRVGLGGPQPAEVERMLAGSQSTLRSDKAWTQKTRQNLKDADVRLDKAFGALLAE
jgi:argininosuccinate lyase